MILKRLKIESTTESYTNCYIIEDEDIKEAMVIDPAGEPEKIIETLELLDTKVKYIYLTHCHADHTSGLEEVKKQTGGTILIYRTEYDNLKNPDVNLSYLMKNVEIDADARVDDGDKLHIRKLRIYSNSYSRAYMPEEVHCI